MAPGRGDSVKTVSGAVVLSIAPPYVRDRTDDKCFERQSVNISKLLEVQASLAHLVLAELGQPGLLSVSFGNQVHHQFAATDGEAR